MNCNNTDEFLEEYNPPEWATKMKNTPTHKLKLGNSRTPIHKWRLPGIPEDFSLSIKRDDLTGSTSSGNKIRQLEFWLAEALNKGCKHLIAMGMVQSNLCRVASFAARQLNLQPHIFILGGVQKTDDIPLTGNALLYRMTNPKFYIPKHALAKDVIGEMEELAELIRESTDESSYIIHLRTTYSIAVYGYINCFKEMIDQGLLDRFDDIVCTTSSGCTLAGLAIGNYLTGSKLRCHGVACSSKRPTKYYHGVMNGVLKDVGLDVKAESIINIIEGYEDDRQSPTKKTVLEFMQNVSTQTGVVLDPKYTGRSALGLVKELNINPQQFQGKRILFIHTGGIFALFDDSLLTEKKPNGVIGDF